MQCPSGELGKQGGGWEKPLHKGLPWWLMMKESSEGAAGDAGLIPGSEDALE